jgi:hypothetical protein
MIAARLSGLVLLAWEVVRPGAPKLAPIDRILTSTGAIMGGGVIRPVSVAARVWVVGLMDAGVAVTFAVIST